MLNFIPSILSNILLYAVSNWKTFITFDESTWQYIPITLKVVLIFESLFWDSTLQVAWNANENLWEMMFTLALFMAKV